MGHPPAQPPLPHAHLCHVAQPHAGTCGSHGPTRLAHTSLAHTLLTTLQGSPVRTPGPGHAALRTQPAWRPLHALHMSLHTRRIPRAHPSPALASAAGVNTCIPAHATCVPRASSSQRPLGSPEHAAGVHGPSGCGHTPAVLSLPHGHQPCSELALPWLDPLRVHLLAHRCAPALPIPLAHAYMLPAG